MKHDRGETLSADLHALLGDAGFLALVETYGGQRPYIGLDAEKFRPILGDALAERFVQTYGGDRLHVPLARAFRARQYRLAGESDKAIALRLGITVSGLERLFDRMPGKPARRRHVDPRQMNIFDR